MSIEVDAIAAIDMHVHVEADGHGHLSLDQELLDASAAYFKSSEHRTPTLEHIAGYQPRSSHGVGPVPDGPGLGIEVDVASLGPPLFTVVAGT